MIVDAMPALSPAAAPAMGETPAPAFAAALANLLGAVAPSAKTMSVPAGPAIRIENLAPPAVAPETVGLPAPVLAAPDPAAAAADPALAAPAPIDAALPSTPDANLAPRPDMALAPLTPEPSADHAIPQPDLPAVPMAAAPESPAAAQKPAALPANTLEPDPETEAAPVPVPAAGHAAKAPARLANSARKQREGNDAATAPQPIALHHDPAAAIPVAVAANRQPLEADVAIASAQSTAPSGEAIAATTNAMPSPPPDLARPAAPNAPAATADFGTALSAQPQPHAPGSAIAEPARPNAPAMPVVSARHGAIGRELGVEIARRAGEGGDTLSVRLHPQDMGRIDVAISFDDAGNLRATVRADNAGALDLLRRDSADLNRALEQAGVRADAQSFRFEGQSGGGGRQPRDDQRPAPFRTPSGEPQGGEPEIAYRALGMPGRLDLFA